MATNPIESIEVETPAEAETAPPLPLYRYFNMVPPAERTVPTPPPDEWLELHMPKAQGESTHGDEADQGTTTATPAGTSQPGTYRTEVPSFGSGYTGYFDGDGRDLLPRPAEVPAIKVNAGIMALKGIGRRLRPFGQAAKNRLKAASEAAASVRMPEIDTKKYVDIATGLGATALTEARGHFERGAGRAKQASIWAREAINLRGEENISKRHKLLKVGGAVVGLTFVGVGGYFAQKYVPEIVHSHSSPEAGPIDPGHLFKNPGGADNPLFNHHHLTIADQAHAITVQAGHHLHRAHQVIVRAGEGYTQVLAKYYHGKSPAELYRGYQEGIKHLGPNFIKGVHHYTMGNGDFGLDQGKAHLSRLAAKFFAHYRWHQ